MAADTERDDTAVIEAAYEARVREAFLILAESLASGEEAGRMKERFRRARDWARKARTLALEVVAEEAARATKG